MVDFTVAIRTYNAAKRLPALLERLKAQVGTEPFQWEILIIDNNSTDDIADIVGTYQQEWNRPFPIRYYLEQQQGAVYSRCRAIAEARGELVGFLDDDNLPELNWVAEAYWFGQTVLEAGAYGGKIRGQFEVPPPPHFDRIASYLAIVDRGDRPFSYNQRSDRVLPPGAGLVIRKQAWLSSVPDVPFLSGPTAGSLELKGEDMEILAYIQRAGWHIYYNPRMEICHWIPRWRLQGAYLNRLVWNIGLAQHHIRMQRLAWWQRPLFFVLYCINDLRKLVTSLIRHRHRLPKDIVTTCEILRLLGAVVSPYYLWVVRVRAFLQGKSVVNPFKQPRSPRRLQIAAASVEQPNSYSKFRGY